MFIFRNCTLFIEWNVHSVTLKTFLKSRIHMKSDLFILKNYLFFILVFLLNGGTFLGIEHFPQLVKLRYLSLWPILKSTVANRACPFLNGWSLIIPRQSLLWNFQHLTFVDNFFFLFQRVLGWQRICGDPYSENN